MVTIGTLSWNINVEGAAEAKKQAQQMNQGVEETAEVTQDSAENLDHLAASYTNLEDLMGDTTQAHRQFEGGLLATMAGYAGLREMMEETAAQSEEERSNVLETIGVYKGLETILGGTTEEQEEQETQSSFLSSGLFFLAAMVGRLVIQYTGLAGILRTVTKAFGLLNGVLAATTGLSFGGWIAKLGSLLKSGLILAFGKLKALGATLLAWGSKFISWMAAGSTGALALAGAIGFVIGMFAVWILKITGVLDWIGQLGEALSVQLPGWARDALVAIIGIFAGGLAVLGGLVIGFIEGGFSGAWDRAAEIVDIFFGSFERTFGRLVSVGEDALDDVTGWFTDMKDDALEAVTGMIDTAKTKLTNFASDISSHITEGFKGTFNAVIPDRLEVPEVTIGGQTVDAGPLGSASIPSYTIGGQWMDMPQLEQGGIVEETGLAQVHEGETYIPRDVRQNMGDGGGGSETKNVTVNVGGIEMGDQSLDLSRMSSMELRNLAEQIADILGTEVDTFV